MMCTHTLEFTGLAQKGLAPIFKQIQRFFRPKTHSLSGRQVGNAQCPPKIQGLHNISVNNALLNCDKPFSQYISRHTLKQNNGTTCSPLCRKDLTNVHVKTMYGIEKNQIITFINLQGKNNWGSKYKTSISLGSHFVCSSVRYTIYPSVPPPRLLIRLVVSLSWWCHDHTILEIPRWRSYSVQQRPWH